MKQDNCLAEGVGGDGLLKLSTVGNRKQEISDKN